MGKLGIDSEKIKLAGENIVKASEKLNTTFDEIFEKLCDVEDYDSWEGASVKKWISIVSSEKQQYFDYSVSVNNFGKQLIEYADSINSIASETIGGGSCQ